MATVRGARRAPWGRARLGILDRRVDAVATAGVNPARVASMTRARVTISGWVR